MVSVYVTISALNKTRNIFIDDIGRRATKCKNYSSALRRVLVTSCVTCICLQLYMHTAFIRTNMVERKNCIPSNF